jgi:hypothetical protein
MSSLVANYSSTPEGTRFLNFFTILMLLTRLIFNSDIEYVIQEVSLIATS